MSDRNDNIRIEQDSEHIVIYVRKDSPIFTGDEIRTSTGGKKYKSSLIAGTGKDKDSGNISYLNFKDSKKENLSYGLQLKLGSTEWLD